MSSSVILLAATSPDDFPVETYPGVYRRAGESGIRIERELAKKRDIHHVHQSTAKASNFTFITKEDEEDVGGKWPREFERF